MPFRGRREILLSVLFLALVTNVVAAKDQFTPVLVSTLTASAEVFPGSDGKQHIVYELELINANPTPATLQKLEVLEESDPTRVIATYDASELRSRMRTLAKTPVSNTDIDFNGARMLLLHLVFDQSAHIPHRLVHRITLLGGSTPAPVPQTPATLTYTVAPVQVDAKVLTIGPPLRGTGWVAFNGCCDPGGAHRASSQTVNGGLFFAQRFAIDWMRLDEKGRLLNGDAASVRSYTGYGADVLAVADGKVVSTFNELQDQPPGTLPDVKTITLENVDGNHIVLDLGNGVFAFYAHLQKDSIKVSKGDQVKRGQVLGRLGNTGNTSAPHLHFHLMDSPSTLGSSGIPYVIDSFEMAGQVSTARFESGESLEGTWNEEMRTKPETRHAQFPLDLAIINFASQE